MITVAPSCPGPVKYPRRPKFKLPAGSWDTQAHIFGPFDKFPLSEKRSYTPEECPLERYLELLRLLGFEYGVLVQGGAHSTDNRAMLDALRRQPEKLRGVSVMNAGQPLLELKTMHKLGVRGVRMSTVVGGSVTFEELPALAEEIAPLGWHVVLHFMRAHEILAIEDYLDRCRTPFVLDHLGRIRGEEGINSEPFQAILRLLHKGKCWVKLSSLYRLSSKRYPYEDMLPMIHKVVGERPDRIIWGSNWPHPILWNHTMPDDGDLVDLIPIWVPDQNDQQRMLVENPRTLYL